MSCTTTATTTTGALAGVRDVAVDLDTGTVTVTSAPPLDRAAVTAAVDEAGYTLA